MNTILLIFALAGTGDIYKCLAGDVVVYSQSPCAEDAELVELEADSSGIGADPADVADQMEKADADREAFREMARRNVAMRRIEVEIKGYKRRQAECQRQMETVANNLAGATLRTSLQDCVNAMDRAISEARTRISSLPLPD